MDYRSVSCAALTVFLFGTAALEPRAKPESCTASRALARILDDYQQYRLTNDSILRQQEGLPVTELHDLSLEEAQRDAAFFRSLSERLKRLDPAKLNHEEWLSREILLYQGALAIEAPDYFRSFFQVTPYVAPFRETHFLFSTFHFESSQDTARYLELLRQYPGMVGQLRTNLEIQRSKGILIPKAEIDPVVVQIRTFITKPDQSAFAVAPGRLEKIGKKEAQVFRTAVERTVAGSINPALENLAGLLESAAYRKAAPERVGIGQYPGGEAA